jgi:hypothetical protein
LGSAIVSCTNSTPEKIPVIAMPAPEEMPIKNEIEIVQTNKSLEDLIKKATFYCIGDYCTIAKETFVPGDSYGYDHWTPGEVKHCTSPITEMSDTSEETKYRFLDKLEEQCRQYNVHGEIKHKIRTFKAFLTYKEASDYRRSIEN